MARITFIVLCMFVASALGHGSFHRQGVTNVTCEEAPFLSYHIHVLFWQNNPDQVAKAMTLQRQFMENFRLLGKPNCTGLFDQPRMCAFEVDWGPAGPFTTAQYSFYITPEWFSKTVPWIMQYRSGFDVLVHPNSGCEVWDHITWPLWGGLKWELDASQLHCNSPGCIPPSLRL